jgi:xanthine/uracil permease
MKLLHKVPNLAERATSTYRQATGYAKSTKARSQTGFTHNIFLTFFIGIFPNFAAFIFERLDFSVR